MTELIERLAVLAMTLFIVVLVLLVLLWIGPLPLWSKVTVTAGCVAILIGTVLALRGRQ